MALIWLFWEAHYLRYVFHPCSTAESWKVWCSPTHVENGSTNSNMTLKRFGYLAALKQMIHSAPYLEPSLLLCAYRLIHKLTSTPHVCLCINQVFITHIQIREALTGSVDVNTWYEFWYDLFWHSSQCFLNKPDHDLGSVYRDSAEAMSRSAHHRLSAVCHLTDCILFLMNLFACFPFWTRVFSRSNRELQSQSTLIKSQWGLEGSSTPFNFSKSQFPHLWKMGFVCQRMWKVFGKLFDNL